MITKLKILISLLLFIASIPIESFAAWQGPQELYQGRGVQKLDNLVLNRVIWVIFLLKSLVLIKTV